MLVKIVYSIENSDPGGTVELVHIVPVDLAISISVLALCSENIYSLDALFLIFYF
jgi:hypothetical protein